MRRICTAHKFQTRILGNIITVLLLIVSLALLPACAEKKPPHKKVPKGKVEAPHKEVIRPAEKKAVPTSEGTPQHTASQNLIAGGKLYYDQKNFELAAMRFRDAINVDPRNWEGYYYLALVDYNLGQKDAALGLLDKAAMLVGSNQDAADRIEKLRNAIHSKTVNNE